MDPYWRWPSVVVLGLIALVLALLLAAWLVMRGSLPQTEGNVRLPGLAHPVTVTRDAHGMPTVKAEDALDAWRVLGFIEAQDRFVQMDFMRRVAGGDLAALVGPAGVAADKKHALFDLRTKARHIYKTATPSERARLEVFSLGVNEGLDALAVRPWPYLLLGQTPRPWKPADSVLVIYAMAFMLEDPQGQRGRSLAALRSLYPDSVVKFLMAPDVHWAAPMRGKLPALPPIPGTGAINLAALPPAATGAAIAAPSPVTGSNNFVVAGRFTQSGTPLLANDMHLPLGIPAIWYRARLVYPSTKNPQDKTALTGVFLPGVPALVAGSNGHVAWGFTDNFGDWVDLIRVPVHGNPPTYATPSGGKTLQVREQRIQVAGRKFVPLKVRSTIWGPVIGTAAGGALLVSHWSVAQPGGTNLAFMNMDRVGSVREGLKLAAQSGIPPQNLLIAGRHHIAWSTVGRIPARVAGCDYTVPQDWGDGHCGWNGWLAPAAYPKIVDPKSGFLATANNRVDASAAGDVLGDGGYVDGARAHQIVADLDRLTQRGDVTTRDLLSVQLDDRADFMKRWHDLILRVLRPTTLEYHPRRKTFRRAVRNWGGHASIDSVGYRLVRDFRLRVAHVTFAPIRKRLKSLYPDAVLPFERQKEGPLWRLVTNKPHNWLNSRYATWNALFINVIDGIIDKYWEPGAGLSLTTWGRRNTVALENRLGEALGPLGSWMNWPAVELPGDSHMPRVQAPDFGASERLVTAPTPSSAAILEVPGGISEHPSSPWYRDGFEAWAKGLAMPMLPGPTRTTLHFKPWRSRPVTPATSASSTSAEQHPLQ